MPLLQSNNRSLIQNYNSGHYPTTDELQANYENNNKQTTIVVQDGRNQTLGMSELNTLLLVLGVNHFCCEFVQKKCKLSSFERPLRVGICKAAAYTLLWLLKNFHSVSDFVRIELHEIQLQI